jgi:hypothetical protein
VLGSKNILCVEDLIHEIYTVGPAFKEASNFLWPFKLSRCARVDMCSGAAAACGGTQLRFCCAYIGSVCIDMHPVQLHEVLT